MKKLFTRWPAHDLEGKGPAKNDLTQLAARLRAKVLKPIRQRVWFILPGRKPETGQKLVLPFSLARLLHERARAANQPAEDLLPVLLQTALLERQPPNPVEQVWRSLTEREREVACLMVTGLTNRQIAAHLTISRTTVRSHARQIVRKFGCPNRSSLPDLRPYCPEQER